MRFLFIIFLFMSATCSKSQVLVTDNGYFLTASGSSKFIVYFRPNSFEPDEYLEGRVFIYDVQKEASSPLSKDNYILNYLGVRWNEDDSKFFISNGTEIILYSFKGNVTKVVFKAGENGVINFFNISSDGKYLAVNVKKLKNGKRYQDTYRVNTENSQRRKIYSVVDVSTGESLANRCYLNEKSTYIHSVDGKLLAISGERKNSQIQIDEVQKVFYLDHKGIYYQKSNSLIRFGLNDKSAFEIFRADDLRVDFIGRYGDDLH